MPPAFLVEVSFGATVGKGRGKTKIHLQSRDGRGHKNGIVCWLFPPFLPVSQLFSRSPFYGDFNSWNGPSPDLRG
jgi:hypothetical protein